MSILLVVISLLVFYYTNSIFWTSFAFIAIIGATVSISYFRKQKKEKSLKKSGISEIDHMDGIQFEYFLAALFKHIGYKVTTTQANSDYGADLLIVKENEKVVIQAKRHMKKVGIKAVQEIVAARSYYEANHAWVVTNNFFTNPATKLARSNGVRLIDRKELIDLILRVNPGSIPNAAEVRIQVTPKKIHCPLCDSKMIERQGKKGKFYGCSRYPSCRGTRRM